MSDALKELGMLLSKAGARITFSINCRSGLLKRCECWRCRKARGEAVTVDSERLAAEQAKRADAKFRLEQRFWIAAQQKAERR